VKLTPARLRVLEMLESGPRHRHDISFAFAKSRKAMSTQAATRLAGLLCKPLIKGGLIIEIRFEGYHQCYEITTAGIRALLAVGSTERPGAQTTASRAATPPR
jgi:hypothetical protein